MYACADVVYGIPITEKLYRFLEQLDGDYDLFEEIFGTDENPTDVPFSNEPKDFGFTVQYSGSSERPVGWMGVQLGGFDECSDFPLSEISNLKPTEAQMKEAQDKIAALHPKIRALCGPIDIYVVWRTS